jgi:hypothetical protein
MKKIIFLLLICFQLTAIAQTEPEVQLLKSKIESLLLENGTLLEATTEEIGTLSYSIAMKVVRLKNLNTGAKISGLVFESNSISGIIDADEMDLLIKSLNTMKEAANSTRPLQTEIRYRSRTGFEISAVYDFERKEAYSNTKTSERKWMYSLRSAARDSRGSSLRPSDFMALCGFVEAARSKM